MDQFEIESDIGAKKYFRIIPLINQGLGSFNNIKLKNIKKNKF